MKRVRPDAILSLGRRKVAIELEMSGKGEQKYNSRFSFYGDHPALDAELHSDLEAHLLEDGSKHSSLWGINLYPEAEESDFVEFDCHD
jgi:hypothetical protein